MSHTMSAVPAGDDPLGRAMLDYQRGGLRGDVRYVDGDRTRDGAIEEHYFTPREDWADDTIERLDGLPGPVLDVGCGAGQHLLWFRDHGVDALGVDVSPGAVRTAEERLADTPVSGPAAEKEAVDPGDVGVREGDLFALDVHREFGSALLNGTQLGLAGSMAGIRQTLTDLADVVEEDGVAQVDGYVASELDEDFFGYRPDPRDGVAHRTFHFEYEREPTNEDEPRRLVGPTLHFLLLDPFRLRDATVGTPWTVERVVPRGVYYKAVLER